MGLHPPARRLGPAEQAVARGHHALERRPPDHGAPGHAQRLEHLLLHQRVERAALEMLDHALEVEVAVGRVLPFRAGLEGEGKRPARLAVREAARMAEDVAGRDLLEPVAAEARLVERMAEDRGDLLGREVLGERPIEAQHLLAGELHHVVREERLRERGGLEDGVVGDGRARARVADAEAPAPRNAAVPDKRHLQAGNAGLGHERRDEGAEAGCDGAHVSVRKERRHGLLAGGFDGRAEGSRQHQGENDGGRLDARWPWALLLGRGRVFAGVRRSGLRWRTEKSSSEGTPGG